MQDALTPMMQQYRRLRGSIPADTLLLFRLGDFYELFFEDAKEAASLLNVALTKRNGVPMCGVPYHAAQSYVAKLIKAGRRVAICDQTSEPQPGKIVSRDITQIISAGTVSDLDLLEAKRANYLGAVYNDRGMFGFAYADLSTGEFRLTQLQDRQALVDELARVSPSELLVSDEQKQQFSEINGALGYDTYAFLPEQAAFTLCEHFKVKSLDGFGCGEMPQAVIAAGAIVHYLKHQLRRNIDHLTSLRCDAPAHYVVLDAATQTNLELVESRSARDTSLLAVLDRTITPMGGRRLRAWILQPLRNLTELECRQQMIADLLQEPDLLASLRASLKLIRDIERAISRLSQASGNARDLVALKISLEQIPKLKSELQKLLDRLAFGATHINENGNAALLAQELQNDLHEMPELAEKLTRAVVDDPPLALKEGGIFRDGYDVDLDALRQASREGKNWISQLQEREIGVTGIKSLKVRYNSVFGYFIEVTKSNLANVPGHYTRKQTTVGGERFITPELKEMEAKILGADERARQREYQLFQKLRDETLHDLRAIQQTADAIAIIDVVCALAETARLFRYCRPMLTETVRLTIKDGRHPVLDQNLVEEKFVPNDTSLEGETVRLAIAWSVAEFLHDKVKARTLFATHYHELTKLAAERSGVCNFNVAVREWNDQIIFLRKIVPGGADKSYGIQVARLAGLPKEILDRAKDILSHLEAPNGAVSQTGKTKQRRSKSNTKTEKPQLDLL